MSGKIFISYRRDDSAPYALSIAQYLERQFGGDSVFIDVDQIRAGENFASVLNSRLGLSNAMLTIIGPNWLTALDSSGKRRLDDPEDWVRMEVATALLKGTRVIPVLVGGAKLPKADELPDDLKPIVKRQAAVVGTNNFRHDMAGLAGDIGTIVGRDRVRMIKLGLAVAAGLILTIAIYNFGSRRSVAVIDSASQRPFESLLNAKCKTSLQTWRSASAVAAFAVASNGNCGFSAEVPKLNAARVAALDACNKNGPDCRVVETIEGDWTLNSSCTAELAKWRLAPTAKAFAVSRSGHCASVTDKNKIDDARTEAMDACDRIASECRIRETDQGNWEMRSECKDDLVEWAKKKPTRAFAVARNGNCGSSWEYGSAEEARKSALSECETNGSECKVTELFEGDWAVSDDCKQDLTKWSTMRGRGSFAVGQSGSCGYSFSYSTISQADSRALQECSSSGGENCKVIYQK
jgi:hypothetical protein